MSKLIQGKRIGRLGALMIGCVAVVFDARRESIADAFAAETATKVR